MTKPQQAPESTWFSGSEIHYHSAGAPLFAVEQGQGLPVVLLHGGLSDHRSTLMRFGALCTTYRLIAPDVRGAGRSIHAADLSWDLFSDDVAALMDHLKLDRAVVGGTSAGSAAALRFALRHPDRVLALVIVWPVYAGADVGLNEAQRIAMHRMYEAGKRSLTDGIEALLALYAALPPPVRDIATAMARGFHPGSVAATTRFLASGAEPFAQISDLGQLSMPTLVVPGVDPEHPEDVAARYAAAIPGAVLGDRDGAASPAAVVEAFLRGL